MPATEATWRDLKLMHVVFGVSSAVMLAATIWMLADDHNRPWKAYQRQFQDIEAWTAQSRIDEQAGEEYRKKLVALEEQFAAARSQPLDMSLVNEFKAEAQSVDADQAKLEEVESAAEEYEVAREENPSATLEAREKLLAQMRDLIARRRFRENNLTTEVKVVRAQLDKARADYDMAVGKAQADDEIATLKAKYDRILAELEGSQAGGSAPAEDSRPAPGRAGLTSQLQAAKLHREELERIYGALTAREAAASKELAEHEQTLAQLHVALAERAPNIPKNILTMPVLDAFGSPLKIDQIWLPELTLNNNFREVARFDRCNTCHQAMDKTQPGSATLPGYQQEHSVTVELPTATWRDLRKNQARDLGIVFQKPAGTDAQGLQIASIDPTSALASPETGSERRRVEGLRKGDVVLSIDDRPVASEKEFLDQLFAEANAGKSIAVRYQRDSAPLSIELTPVDFVLTETRLRHEQQYGSTEAENLTHEQSNDYLAGLYGLQIAERGLLSENDATISVVFPERRAAVAGLMSADVIEFIGDAKIKSGQEAIGYLINRTEWTPLALTVRRGLPHPFSSHPRLDLFVGSMSPHPMGEFGCTICHQGQGSATSFDWASHTPDNLEQASVWARQYGWFNNHHWIFPMHSARFAESACLKCHHQVTELESSPRFPDGPAPKLMKGYQLILDYGCYGCHEINGFDGPTKRIGPDLRNEPNYFAAAAQLLVDPGLKKLNGDAESLARQVVDSPEDDQTRRRLHELVATDLKRAADVASQRIKDPSQAAEMPQPVLSAQSHKMEPLLRDVEAPGTLRRVGPSLRHVAAKNSFEFLFDWIEDPHRFRPSTKMPRFFGLHDHLDGQGLDVAKEFEPIEVRAISEYLLGASQPFEYLKPAENAKGDAERGKTVFELRGCLACHSHSDFPRGKATHGPDLSRIGAKLATSKSGKDWLYSWVRKPNRYHSRTVMPDTFLEPVTDAQGNTSDPALDVTEYLLTSQQDWKPRQVNREMTSVEIASLEKLALQNLEEKLPGSRARQFLQNGIPASQAAEIKGDEIALVGMTAENRLQKITEYVGRRGITKYGCFGCHDIPGFEDAKPIGTGLADWGRKEPSRLAFENIMQYLHNGHGAQGDGPHADHAHTSANNSSSSESSTGLEANALVDNTADYSKTVPFGLPEPEPLAGEMAANREFFIEKIASHEREGFIWQKLNDPRSYDYKKTENKRYNERLRMPKFYFSQEQHENDAAIEAIMTFVLGLVSEPPAAQYVYRATPEREALVSGRKLLERFNCGGCHVLEMDRWQIEYRPGWAAQDAEINQRKDQFTEPVPEFDDFEFLRPHFTPEQLETAQSSDRRNRLHATIVGTPLRNHSDGSLKRFDDEGVPLEADDPAPGNFEFILYEPAIINGVLWPVGSGRNVPVQPSMLASNGSSGAQKKVYPARGGDLARLLFPVVVAGNATYNTDAKAQEAWGWLPPTLHGQGRKVQTDWLHRFLLDPHQIRPAAVLRMPKFNMSSQEAQTLANYFAAVDGAAYPYAFDERTTESHLDRLEDERPNRLRDALNIVTEKTTYCVQCHFVGDYSPQGNDPKAFAPQLERVHERLRPDYVHNWIGNPKRILPYTGMPQNFPPTKPADQKLFAGTSHQQLDAVVDLLMSFDRYAKEQFSIKAIVKEAPPPAASGNSASAEQQKSSQ